VSAPAVLIEGIVFGESPSWHEATTLLRREPDGSLVPHADLSQVSTKPWNDIGLDESGNTYVNTIGFDFPAGEYATGAAALVAPDGNVAVVC
jgi:sugar lactone lactonase YvrE